MKNYTPSEQLTYLDEENWECKDRATPSFINVQGFKMGHSQHIFTMYKGKLRISLVDLDQIVGPTEYDLQQKPAVYNWIKRFIK